MSIGHAATVTHSLAAFFRIDAEDEYQVGPSWRWAHFLHCRTLCHSFRHIDTSYTARLWKKREDA